jgi:hypothetical protein
MMNCNAVFGFSQNGTMENIAHGLIIYFGFYCFILIYLILCISGGADRFAGSDFTSAEEKSKLRGVYIAI